MITITADSKTPPTTHLFFFSFFFSQSQRHSHKEQFSPPTSVRCSMWMVSVRNPVFPLSCLWCSIFEVSYVPNILFRTLACSICDFSRGEFSSFSSRKASCGRTSLPSLISPRILEQNFVKTTWLSGQCFLQRRFLNNFYTPLTHGASVFRRIQRTRHSIRVTTLRIIGTEGRVTTGSGIGTCSLLNPTSPLPDFLPLWLHRDCDQFTGVTLVMLPLQVLSAW